MYQPILTEAKRNELIDLYEKYHAIVSTGDSELDYVAERTRPKTAEDILFDRNYHVAADNIITFLKNLSTAEYQEVVALHLLGDSLLHDREDVDWDGFRKYSLTFDHNFDSLDALRLHQTIPAALTSLNSQP